jgi:ABC-type sugar transport system ATPase subunit
VALMRDGHLQAYGTPEELYGRPPNLFVAEFVGTPPMNVLPAELATGDGGVHAVSGGLDVALSPRDAARLRSANGATPSVTLGIRPEDLVLVPVDQGHGNGEVYVVEPLGREQVVDVRIVERTLRVLAPPSFAGQIGDRVGVRLNIERLHLFQWETGDRLN